MGSIDPRAQHARETGEVLFDADQVARAYDHMAALLDSRLAGTNPVVLCVMVGGLVPTAELIRRLDFPLELDYLQVSRYRGETAGGELEWRCRPQISLAGRHVLVIDDVLDEGHTLVQIRAELSRQHPAEIVTAVLVDKQVAGRDPALDADVVGLRAPDRYLFGCGMDIHNYFRQLPYIIQVP